jgi:hypothetical protein
MSQYRDDIEAAGPVAGAQQVVDLLEAYADARLTPRGAVLARMRRQVMAEAAGRAASGDGPLAAAIAASQPKRPWSALHLQRRVAAVGMAAVLTFATSAAVLAAPPGSPFYNARVVLEQVFLPSEPDDRVAAVERHLEARLAEAQAAADRGDLVALQASLDAFRSEVDAAVAEVGWSAEHLAHLEAVLGKHTAVLEALAAKLPEQASIEHAIETSQKAAKKLHDKGKPADPGKPGPDKTPPGPNQR